MPGSAVSLFGIFKTIIPDALQLRSTLPGRVLRPAASSEANNYQT